MDEQNSESEYEELSSRHDVVMEQHETASEDSSDSDDDRSTDHHENYYDERLLHFSQEVTIQVTDFAFACRYFGTRDGNNRCTRYFTNTEDELDHIIKFHNIIAAPEHYEIDEAMLHFFEQNLYLQ